MFGFLLTVAGLFLFIDLLVWHFRFSRAIDRPAPPSGRLPRYPSVSVIRPVRGTDSGQEENFRAALDTGYPGEVETIFIFDEASDPGLPKAQAVVNEHTAAGRPGGAWVHMAGAPPPDRTGKLNAMMVGLRLARGELVAFSDSDTRPDQEVLRVLVETLVQGAPRVGCTFAPVVVRPRASFTAGDLGYAMMVNSLYGPAAALAAAQRGSELPFIMGQFMVFSRRALDAVGGVGCAEGQLVDDMYIGKCLNEAGYANVMIKHPLTIVADGLSFGAFLKTYRRWLLFARNGLPLVFVLPLVWRAVSFFLAILLAAAAFGTGHWLAAPPALAALLFQGISAAGLQRGLGGPAVPLRHAWMLWSLFLLAPAIIVSMVWNGVDWRGRVYRLDAKARLAMTRRRAREVSARVAEAVWNKIRGW